MKKKLLFLAGALALVACQKEANLVSSEEMKVTTPQGNISLKVDRNATPETKTIFNKADYKNNFTLWWYGETEETQDALGVYVYNKKAEKTTAEPFKTSNSQFKTTALAHKKSSAVFTGEVTFPVLNLEPEVNPNEEEEYDEPEDFNIYAVYPYNDNVEGSLEMRMDYTTKITSLDVKEYNPNYAKNSFMLFRSNEAWSFVTDFENQTVGVAMTGKNLAGAIEVSFTIPDEEDGDVLKKITLEAFDESGVPIEFPTCLNADPLHFDNYDGTYASMANDFESSENLEALEFPVNEIELEAEKEYSVILPAFPTEVAFRSLALTLSVEKGGYDEELALIAPKELPRNIDLIAGGRLGLDFGELSTSRAATAGSLDEIIALIKAGNLYIKIGDPFTYGTTTGTPVLTLPAESDYDEGVKPFSTVKIEGTLADESVYITGAGSPIKNLYLKNGALTNPATSRMLTLDAANINFNLEGQFSNVNIKNAANVTIDGSSVANQNTATVQYNTVEGLTVGNVKKLSINSIVTAPAAGQIIGKASEFELKAGGKIDGDLTINNTTAVKATILGTIDGNITITKGSEVKIDVKNVEGDVTIEDASTEVNIYNTNEEAFENDIIIGVDAEGNEVASSTANVVLDGLLGATTVYTKGGTITVKNGAKVTAPFLSEECAPSALYIYGNLLDEDEEALDVDVPASARTVKIGLDPTTELADPETATLGEVYIAGNADVSIGEKAELASLELEDPASVYINGKVIDGDVITGNAATVVIGPKADISGDLYIAPDDGESVNIEAKYTAGTPPTLQDAAKIRGMVTVANMKSLIAEAYVGTKWEVNGVDDVNIKLVKDNADTNPYALDNGIRFRNCQGTIDFDATGFEFGNEATVTFIGCKSAEVTLSGVDGVDLIIGGTSTSQKVKNVTLNTCQPKDLTINATGNVTINEGTYTGDVNITAAEKITVDGKLNATGAAYSTDVQFNGSAAGKSVALAAKNIEIGNVSFNENTNKISTKATSTLTVGNELTSVDFSANQTVLKIDAGTGTAYVKNAKLHKVQSYVNTTFDKCVVTNNCFEYLWVITGTGSTAKRNYTDLTFTVKDCLYGDDPARLPDEPENIKPLIDVDYTSTEASGSPAITIADAKKYINVTYIWGNLPQSEYNYADNLDN